MNNPVAMDFHHYGLAVETPNEAFLFLRGLGYEIGDAVFDPLQHVNLALCCHGAMPAVEVIWPGDGPSPIDQILKRGPSICHICYATCDAEARLAAMEAYGVELITISPPTPALLFGGLNVSFHFGSGFGLFEIIHLTGDPARDAAAGLNSIGKALALHP